MLLILYCNFKNVKCKPKIIHKHYYNAHGLYHVHISNFGVHQIAAYKTCTQTYFYLLEKTCTRIFNFLSPFLRGGIEVSKC